MRPLKPFREWGIVLLSFLAFSACHGGGGGAAPAPIPTTVLTVGAPVSDTIVHSTFNAYSATVTPGFFYKISITAPTDDVDLNVYDTDNTFRNPIICPIDNGAIIGTSPEDCILIPSGNTLYFGVDGVALAGSTAVYTIDVELLPETNLNLSIPSGNQTTQREAAAYSVPVPPGIYTVSTTGLTDDVDLSVFTESGAVVTAASCSPHNPVSLGKGPEDCTLTVNTPNTAVLFIVDGLFSSAFSVQYTVLVTPAPNVPSPINEGVPPAPPIVITAGTPTTAQVGPAGTSRYEVDILNAGSRYTISITGLTEAANLSVFLEKTFTTQADCLIPNTSLPGTVPESCTLIAPPGGTVFFTVTSSAPTTGSGSAYLILVEPGP